MSRPSGDRAGIRLAMKKPENTGIEKAGIKIPAFFTSPILSAVAGGRFRPLGTFCCESGLFLLAATYFTRVVGCAARTPVVCVLQGNVVTTGDNFSNRLCDRLCNRFHGRFRSLRRNRHRLC